METKLEAAGFVGGREAQIIDRQWRAKGEKMGVLLCIVHVLMIK